MSWIEDFIARHTPIEEPEEDMWERLERQAGCYSYDDYDDDEG